MIFEIGEDSNCFTKIELYLMGLPRGKYEIRQYSEQRNLDQNRLYHAMLGYVAHETGNDSAYLHEMMKKKFLSKKRCVKLGKKRTYVYTTQSTTQLTTKSFSKYIEDVDAFFLNVGIIFPKRDSLEFQNLVSTYGR